MRILVLSDSHGRVGALDRIIEKEQSAFHIFFLGDVIRDIENLVHLHSDRNFHIVSGNCDYFSTYPAFDFARVGETKILFSHGHTFSVRSGDTGRLVNFAAENECSITLYGHTHVPDIDYKDGIYIVNPGSVGRSREGAESYAVLDISKSGVLPHIIRI